MFLPYIKGIREEISKAYRPLGIHLRKSLKKVKERPGMTDVNDVVHSIPCVEYSAQTEHMRVMKNKDSRNGIVIHVQKTANTIIGKKPASL